MRPVVTTALSVAVLMLALGLTASPAAAQSEMDEQPDQTVVFDIQPQGDARVSVTFTYQLDTPAKKDRFNDTAEVLTQGGDRIGSKEYAKNTAKAIENAAKRKNSETDREIAVSNKTYSARIDNDVGYLNQTFTVSNFTRMPAHGEQVNLTKSFVIDNRSWFPRTYSNQRLLIVRPKNHNFAYFSGGPTKNGDTLVYGPQSSFTGTITLGREPIGNGGGLPSETVLQVLAFVGIVLLTTVAFTQREQLLDRLPTTSGAPTPAERPSPDEASPSPAPSPASDDSESDAPLDMELLSDEEKVVRLLQQNGGRMRQATIVKSTGWSDAKVSQLLSGMDDDEQIEKLRLGRENLISLPDHETDAESSTDHGYHGHNRS